MNAPDAAWHLADCAVPACVGTLAAEGIPVGKDDIVRTIKAFIKKHPVLTYLAAALWVVVAAVALTNGGQVLR